LPPAAEAATPRAALVALMKIEPNESPKSEGEYRGESMFTVIDTAPGELACLPAPPAIKRGGMANHDERE